MVSKKVLLDVISKYSLGGLIERAKWTIKDKKFNTIFMGSGYKGMVEYNGDFNLKEGNYAIWETPQLVRCLNILDEDILIEASHKGGVPTHFNIADTNYEIVFSLSDLANFSDNPTKSQPPAPDASFDISDEFFTRFIKSTDILSGTINPLFSIKSAEGFTGSELIFNVETGHTSIDFAIEAEIKQEIKPFYFNVDLIKVILKANKNYTKGTFNAYIIPNKNVLLIKLEFETETGIKTKYQINNTIK
tara:strand:+ start:218 stop:958 length:741 start_codon:yes stop_codon:yes gene_type:complete